MSISTVTPPADLKTGWLNVARRMQSVAASQGYAIITIRVLVNAEGLPVLWTEPSQCKIEPKVTNVEAALAFLAGTLDNRRE